jgi:hypothetical protein
MGEGDEENDGPTASPHPTRHGHANIQTQPFESWRLCVRTGLCLRTVLAGSTPLGGGMGLVKFDGCNDYPPLRSV